MKLGGARPARSPVVISSSESCWRTRQADRGNHHSKKKVVRSSFAREKEIAAPYDHCNSDAGH